MGQLNGQTALVTGAGRGIGREIALRLAADGAFVIVHYGKSREKADAVLAEIKAAGGDGVTVGADLEQFSEIARLFEGVDAALAARGANRLDILINNAGIGMARNLEAITLEEFERVIAIDTRAPLFICQQAIKRMEAGCRIINISSMVGHNAYGGGLVAYGAAKAALDYMTLSMAAFLGPRGITVNAVAPGATETDFIAGAMGNPAIIEHLKKETALRALGDPKDVAAAVALFVQPGAGWITGERVRASGGSLL